MAQRYGENGRHFPEQNKAIWEGLSSMLEKGLIKPVIFDKRYQGLESVPDALKDLAERKIWGKVVVLVAPETGASKL